ncbi:MAG TPA: hypothetical protein PLX33_04360 [Alphaproteobacteria bacterium]|nr:hypothetical protein [Alphaproteobacteria bacterium]
MTKKSEQNYIEKLYMGVGQFAVSYENLFEILRYLLWTCLKKSGMKNSAVSWHMISGLEGHALIETVINVLSEMYCDPHELRKPNKNSSSFQKKLNDLRNKLMALNQQRVIHVHAAWLCFATPDGAIMQNKYYGVKTGRSKRTTVDHNLDQFEKDASKCAELAGEILKMKAAIEKRKNPLKII